jgi:signal transduction histidine kinase
LEEDDRSASDSRILVPRELEVFLLGSLAINILTGLRLREEKATEIQKGEAARVAALNLAREETVQRIAHALHNPLDSLEARVKKTSDLFAEANRVLSGLREETRGLREVSQKLLLAFSTRDLSKLLAPNPSQVLLKTFLETVVFLNKTLFESKGIDLQLEATEDCTVELDADMLLEVMDNLLKNAARYARKVVVIKIERQPLEKVVRLKVKDDGPGIAPDIRKHLFEPGTSELKDGTHGFGLYYSRELMRRQGGDLRAVEVESGAEFSVEMRSATTT